MYATCPKCGHDLAAAGATDATACPACSVVFAKWLKQQLAAARPPTSADPEPRPGFTGWWRPLADGLLHVEERPDPVRFWGRVLVFAGIAAWGLYFIRLDFVSDPYTIGRSFMHNVNLVFHEAGHVLFRPFGWFMTILGGSLFQLLMPAILVGVFLVRYHNTFAAAVCLWWLGQSFMDCAPYIDDALDQKLVLLGGHTGADAPGNHDWNNILGDLNMLERHREFATLADTIGTILILLALLWGAALLWRQYRNLQ